MAIGLAIGYLAQAQPGKPSVRHFVSLDRIPTAAQISKALISIPPDSAIRLGIDGVSLSGNLQANAACQDGKNQAMRLGVARFHEDTLIISLLRTDRRYVYELETKVWRGEFSTQYHIISRDGGSRVTFLPTDQVLVLEHMAFDRGKTLAGFVNFRGARWEQRSPARPWESKMDWVESNAVVRGPFKITIQ